MAKPLTTGKQSVPLPSGGARPSRIRRDPPPIAKQTVVPDRDEVEQRAVVIGVLAFTLAIIAILIGISATSGWSPRQVTVQLDDRGGY